MKLNGSQTDELGKIHAKDFMDNNLPDGCADLLIADPPYFEIKGEFDFAWESFEEYLEDVEKWAKECKRVLAENGTLFWYGHAKNIAYAQIIFDKHLQPTQQYGMGKEGMPDATKQRPFNALLQSSNRADPNV